MRILVALLLAISCSLVYADERERKWQEAGISAAPEWLAHKSAYIKRRELDLKRLRRARGTASTRKAEADLELEIAKLKKERLTMPAWQKPRLSVESMNLGDVGYFFDFEGDQPVPRDFHVVQVVSKDTLLMRDKGVLVMGVGISTANLSDGTNVIVRSAFEVGPSKTYENALGTTNTVPTVHVVSDEQIREFISHIPEETLLPKRFREWEDATKTFTTEAQLVGLDEKDVILEKRDGTTVVVPLVKLSASDREFALDALGVR